MAVGVYIRLRALQHGLEIPLGYEYGLEGDAVGQRVYQDRILCPARVL